MNNIPYVVVQNLDGSARAEIRLEYYTEAIRWLGPDRLVVAQAQVATFIDLATATASPSVHLAIDHALGGPRAISGDGQTCVVAGHGEIVVWNPETGETILRIEDTDHICLTLSHNGQLLAIGGEERRLRVLTLPALDERFVDPTRDHYPSILLFESDATLLAGNCDGTIQRYKF